MKATKPLLLASVSSVALLSGCATVQPRQSFPQVERFVSERTGYRVHWNDGTDADQAVAAQVETVLAKPLDADAAVQVALLNNRNLQATYEELGVAQADLVAAGLLRNPVFDGSVRFLEGGGSPTIDLGVAFDFLDVFFIGLRKRLAEAQLEAAKANVTAAVLDMAGDVKVAFYDLQAAEQAVELRRQVVQATAASYELAQRLRAAGNNRPLDLANERALYEESKLALAVAETDAVVARETLNRLMGLWGPRTHWAIAGRMAEPPQEEPLAEGLERQAVANSLALQSARNQITIALRELGITRPLGYLSELEVGAAAERDDGEWEVGPTIALPVPIFSQGQPAVARAQAQLRRAQQEFYATAVEVRSNIRATYARVRSLRQQVDYYRAVLLPLRQSIVDQTQLQYNAMQIGAFQLLQAKRDQVEAARTYLALLRDYWTAKTELELGLRGRAISTPSMTSSAPSATPMSSNASEGH